jgi:hypothetical protein
MPLDCNKIDACAERLDALSKRFDNYVRVRKDTTTTARYTQANLDASIEAFSKAIEAHKTAPSGIQKMARGRELGQAKEHLNKVRAHTTLHGFKQD